MQDCIDSCPKVMLVLMRMGKATFTRKNSAGNKDFKRSNEMISIILTEEQTVECRLGSQTGTPTT